MLWPAKTTATPCASTDRNGPAGRVSWRVAPPTVKVSSMAFVVALTRSVTLSTEAKTPGVRLIFAPAVISPEKPSGVSSSSALPSLMRRPTSSAVVLVSPSSPTNSWTSVAAILTIDRSSEVPSFLSGPALIDCSNENVAFDVLAEDRRAGGDLDAHEAPGRDGARAQRDRGRARC